MEARPELKATFEPLLSSVATLKLEIGRLDEAVMACAKAAPACRVLMSAPGVGPVTALAYAATIDDPNRFAKSRTVGAYLGMTTRRFQSGEMDYSGRITKWLSLRIACHELVSLDFRCGSKPEIQRGPRNVRCWG